MLRLKPIRRRKRRGPSREVLRIAQGAFWLSLLFALLIGANAVLPLRLPAVRAGVVPAKVVRVNLPAAGSQATPLAAPLRFRGRPVIAIVIDDLGGDVVHTKRAILLPRAVALAFLPYPKDTPALARAAKGHEVLVHAPMQAMGEANPGPMALSVDLTPDEIVRRLDWDLARVPGFVGINNHEGSRFTADGAALAVVMRRLQGRDIFFFDSRTTADTQVIPVARAYGIETASRDVFLDDVPTIDGVDAQLRVLEAKARAQGVAIAIGHPHEITLDAVAYWAAHERGFDLVPLREAIRRKTELSLSLAGG